MQMTLHCDAGGDESEVDADHWHPVHSNFKRTDSDSTKSLLSRAGEKVADRPDEGAVAHRGIAQSLSPLTLALSPDGERGQEFDAGEKGQFERSVEFTSDEKSSLQAAAVWLLDLQNRDGGWPTFCRGWGTLPFDRSSCDLTAHALRALSKWLKLCQKSRRNCGRKRKSRWTKESGS